MTTVSSDGHPASGSKTHIAPETGIQTKKQLRCFFNLVPQAQTAFRFFTIAAAKLSFFVLSITH